MCPFVGCCFFLFWMLVLNRQYSLNLPVSRDIADKIVVNYHLLCPVEPLQILLPWSDWSCFQSRLTQVPQDAVKKKPGPPDRGGRFDAL